jgi:hypothetical protein
MKTLIIFLLISTHAFSQVIFEKELPAVVRTPSFRAVIDTVQLPNLISANNFEGLNFKIVKGKTDDAISFDESDSAVLLRAATTYYHLEKARTYFVEVLKSEYVKSLPQLIVRLEHFNQFNELGHFANDNLEPQYNNALTIPAGKGLASRNIKPWNMEIWFRPVKEIHRSELNIRDDAGSFDAVLKSFRQQTHMGTFQRFIVQVFNGSIANFNPSVESIFRLVGSSVVMEAGNFLYDPLKKGLSRRWYSLDTALIPEIIYHEYSHVALSDKLVLSHSTAVIEGMADFFAGTIANSPKLATRIKKYNTYSGKNAKRKKDFALQFELTDYANTDFVFGMLWELKSILGEEEGLRFVYSLREKLTTNSTIRKQLLEGITKTCDEVCSNPFVDKLSIFSALNLRGI